MNGIFSDKIVVITGGTGSLGKIMTKRLLSGEEGTPRKVIIFSRDEAKQHYMRVSYETMKNSTDEIIYYNYLHKLQFVIGDIRDYYAVRSVLRDDVDIVIIAHALKQVPIGEKNPIEFIKTNVLGIQNIIDYLKERDSKIQTVVGISTDKAVNPENTYGATKLLMERLLISANIFLPKIRFGIVRYGNILSSRGSVLPLFHEQITKKMPLTITTPDMTRFLLPLNKGVDTIFEYLKTGLKGEIVLPQVPASKILNIAELLIEYNNKELPIKIIGIRQGEKIHEYLVSKEEVCRTYNHRGYYHIQPMLPELMNKDVMIDMIEKEYCSKDFVMSKEETKKLLEENNLLDNKNLKIEY